MLDTNACFGKGMGVSEFVARKDLMNTSNLIIGLVALSFLPGPARAAEKEKVHVSIVRKEAEGPRIMVGGGLASRLEKLGCEIKSLDIAVLTSEEQRGYGPWKMEALESSHIGTLVAKNSVGDDLIIGLLGGCGDTLGMLAGMQHLQPAVGPSSPDPRGLQRKGLVGLKPLRVGLIYFDAHADFNTPETSNSGLYGGMDVATAAGLCLARLRIMSGLDPALPTRYIVLGGLRDVDPLEQELLDRSLCAYLTVEDIRTCSNTIDLQMKRLSQLTDVIYVHVDMDVLDPREVGGHRLTVPDGPTSVELASAIRKIFGNPKAQAIGIASMPYGDKDKEGLSLQAAYRLIEGAVYGLLDRR